MEHIKDIINKRYKGSKTEKEKQLLKEKENERDRKIRESGKDYAYWEKKAIEEIIKEHPRLAGKELFYKPLIPNKINILLTDYE